MMGSKILTFILIALIFQAYSIDQRCEYISLGKIIPEESFTCTTKKTWTKQSLPTSHNPSQYLQVNGFRKYNQPHDFFTALFSNGNNVQKKLQCFKDVKDSYQLPPEFKMEQLELLFAYGNPSLAKLCKIPEGKSLIAVRFQVPASGEPRIGRYSAIVDLVDKRDLSNALSDFKQAFLTLAQETKLKILDVMAALNIVPEFTESSIFSVIKKAKPSDLGTVKPVVYQAFIVAYRESQTVLVGSIDSGQPGVYQSYHVTPEGQKCGRHQLEGRQ